MQRNRIRAAIAGALLACCGACQFLQNEFTTVVVPPPSAQSQPAPTPQPW